MNRRKAFVILMSSAAVALVTSTGCRPKKQPPAQKPFESPVISDAGQRMSELQRSAQSLSGIVRQLPGRDVSQDRQLLAQAFDATHQALSMMGGTEPDGALRQQLGTIANVRQFRIVH